MRILFLIVSLLFSFEVEYTKIYKKYIIPKKEAIEIKTKTPLTFPFNYTKTKNGYILYGDINSINLWLENNFYPPKDAIISNIKISLIDYDKIQSELIQNLKKTYKNCTIKKIVFLTPSEVKIITKPTTIELKYKITLNCK